MTTIANVQKVQDVQRVQEVIARIWSDTSLKAKLIDNPKSVLADYGLEFPSSVEVQVHENTASLMNYVLPQASEIPEGIDLEEVEPVAGKVIKRALADEAFRARLLSDPKPAIAEATNVTLPMSLEIHVYEDTQAVKHLVLPVNPMNEELSDFELEMIAGGKTESAKIGAACGTTAGVAGSGAAAAIGFPPAAVAMGLVAGGAGIISAIGGLFAKD